MKNNKGFTLVELLAMLVVLGILMAITVPNISGILSQQKETAFIEDASKLINTAKMKMSTDREIKRPANGNCIVFSMTYLDKAAEMKISAPPFSIVTQRSENAFHLFSVIIYNPIIQIVVYVLNVFFFSCCQISAPVIIQMKKHGIVYTNKING